MLAPNITIRDFAEWALSELQRSIDNTQSAKSPWPDSALEGTRRKTETARQILDLSPDDPRYLLAPAVALEAILGGNMVYGIEATQYLGISSEAAISRAISEMNRKAAKSRKEPAWWAQAKQLFSEGGYTSKESAAQDIASKVNKSVRTVRDLLSKWR